jgi:hypothetical protein
MAVTKLHHRKVVQTRLSRIRKEFDAVLRYIEKHTLSLLSAAPKKKVRRAKRKR